MTSIFSDTYLTTIGVKIDKKTVAVDAHEMTLMLWDIYGQDEFQNRAESYLRGASGYLLVVDGTRRATLDTRCSCSRPCASRWARCRSSCASTRPTCGIEWEIDLDVVSARARDEGWMVIETSAKLGAGVEEAFSRLTARMLTEAATT